MNAIVTLPSSKSRVPPSAELMIAFNAPANDGQLKATGGVFGPEEPLSVRFEGLSADEAKRALGSFPGAKRCVLATD